MVGGCDFSHFFFVIFSVFLTDFALVSGELQLVLILGYNGHRLRLVADSLILFLLQLRCLVHDSFVQLEVLLVDLFLPRLHLRLLRL